MLIPFDILYEGFCNRIRTAEKSDHILKILKNESTDRSRIHALLQDEPELLPLLERNISDCFETKDECMSRQLWKRGVEGKSLTLLTEAISYCPIPALFEEKVVPTFNQSPSKVLLQSFMECSMKEKTDDPSLMASLFYDRACILCSRNRFASAFKDFIRAWLLGVPKSLDMTYQVAICSYECGELEHGKELLQCTAQHLRTLAMSNEKKSEWTMIIVKALKTIEAIRKANSKQHNSISRLPEGNFTDLTVNPKASEEIEMFSTLFMGPSEAIDVASKGIMLKHSSEKGRHMVATENIPPGSTIIAEMPYAWTLSKQNYHRFCLWCLQRIDAGIPCSTCASAIFCNSTCREKAMSSFHAKECRVMKLLDSSQKLGNMALLCFRTILMTPLPDLQTFVSEENSVQELTTKLATAEITPETLNSRSYSSVFAQTPNSEQRQSADLLKRTISAIFLAICLRHTGYLSKSCQEAKSTQDEGQTACEEKVLVPENDANNIDIGVAALLLRHLQSASCNAYGINYIESKRTPEDQDGDHENHLRISEIGGATYPIISTTNHSCNPNAYRINVPGKACLVKTLREIKVGEEIFDCYGPLYLTEARSERISKLQTQYLFRCSCLACTENWPSFSELRKLPLTYKCSGCLCALKVDNKNASKIKCPYCDFVTDMKKLENALTVQKERFSLAKTTILGEVFQPFDKDMEMEIICEYIKTCQVAYMDPCMASVEAQEILKLFWNLSIRNL